MTVPPSSAEAVKLLASSCARSGAHFSAIAAELEVLDAIGGNQLESLRESEQSQSVDATEIGSRRKRRRMINTKRNAEGFMGITAIAGFLDLDVRAFRRLRRDASAKFPAPHRFGSSQRWKASEVRGWVERQRLKS